MVGAASALYAARAGLDVVLVDRGPVAGGTTGAGEGNLLVSDKEPGPELELALLSGRLWTDLAQELGEAIEYEAKGGLVVASTPRGLPRWRPSRSGSAPPGSRPQRSPPGNSTTWSPTWRPASRAPSTTRRTPR